MNIQLKLFLTIILISLFIGACSKKSGCPMNDTKKMNKPGKTKTGRLY
jgi:hypothetical protein